MARKASKRRSAKATAHRSHRTTNDGYTKWIAVGFFVTALVLIVLYLQNPLSF